MYVLNMYVRTCSHIYEHIASDDSRRQVSMQLIDIHARINVYVYVCTCVCTKHATKLIYMHVSMCMCLHVHAYVHIDEYKASHES